MTRTLFLTFLLLSVKSLGFGQQMDSTRIANDFLTKGNENLKLQEFEEAIVNYLEAVKILEVKKDTARLVRVYTNIGVVNARLKDFGKAILYFEKSLSYIKNDDNLKLQVLTNIAGLYYDTKDFEKSLKTNAQSEILAKKLNNEAILSNIYGNYCNVYRELKEYSKSISYGQQSLYLKEKLNLNTEIVTNNIGYSYLLNKQYDNAIRYFEKISDTKNIDLRVLVFNNLKSAHEANTNAKRALGYANMLLKLKDSIYEVERNIKVATLVEKYESDKKQQQIDVLNVKSELQQTKLTNQKRLFIGFALLGILTLLAIYFWFKNHKTKQSLKQAALQHKLLQTQLNPHFLFHSLNSIQTFIHQNKTEESSSYLVSYSKLMRSILESSDQDFIPIKDDIDAIENYIRLQKLNLSNTSEIRIDHDDKIENYKIPPMFVQPYVENALIHGINDLANGKISISYKDAEDKIEVIVKDNGQGVKRKQHNNELHRSMSTDIINQRIENLRKIHQYTIKVTTISNEKGTIVTLEFPKKV